VIRMTLFLPKRVLLPSKVLNVMLAFHAQESTFVIHIKSMK